MSYYQIRTYNAMSCAFMRYLESPTERPQIKQRIRERFDHLAHLGTRSALHGNLSSFGTSGKRRFYEWGPNFKQHYHFLNELFYYGLPEWIYLRFSAREYTKLHRDKEDLLTVFCSENPPHENDRFTFRNTGFSISPLYLYFHLKRFPSVLSFFDLDTCVFCLTGSELKPEHKALFDNLGLKYRDHMRCWDSGATYFTCPFGHKHWVDVAFDYKWEGDRFLATDLWNIHQPHIDFDTKDDVTWSRSGEVCECGLDIDEISVSHEPKDIVIKDEAFKYDWVNAGVNVTINGVLNRCPKKHAVTIIVGIQRHGENPEHPYDKIILISEEPITRDMHEGIIGQFWGMPIEVWSGHIVGDFGRKLPRVFETRDHPGVVELDQPIKA